MTLGNSTTLARILRSDATIAHRVAFDIGYQSMIYWCQVAHWNATHPDGLGSEHTAKAMRHMLGNLNSAEYYGRIAEAAVWRIYDAQRDYGHQREPGSENFSLSGGTPVGVMDICYSAALVCASLTALVEPEDYAAEIIAEWYRIIVTEEWDRPLLCPAWERQPDGSIRADITGAVLRPQSVRSWMVENEAQWPEPTPFRRRLDQIKARKEARKEI